MVHVLARRPKTIAWFFITLFYLELLMVPSVAGAQEGVTLSGMNRPLPKQGSAFKDNFLPYSASVIESPLPVKKERINLQVSGETSTGSEEDMGPSVNNKYFIGGPSQPEMQSFQSVNGNNLVDLFTGDFSYSIPLLDVGGYPVNLGYRGGISMDQEASWVGLGWNINPGTVTRNMRGLPDDFNGNYDSIRKVSSIRENKTIGVTLGANVEIAGFPKDPNTGKLDTVYPGVSIGASLGVFHNNYRGWGLEYGLNASINSGTGAKGPLSGGLSVTNNTQEGLTITPSLSVNMGQKEAEINSISGSFSTSLPYNSRSGIKGLQLSTGIRQYVSDKKNQYQSGSFSSFISFASPSFTPTISIPYTSRQFSFTAKVGTTLKVFHPSMYLSGYISKQGIDAADTLLALPSYGYLHFDEGAKNAGSLLDFNREKEVPYREKPPVPHIGVPAYTYDAFSITGEGTGGMFRAYRGDIGFVHDHFMRTKDHSDRLSVDIGLGDMVHGGVDLNINRAYTQTGPWISKNTLAQTLGYKKNSGSFEAVYFRNPGEKAINSKQFYEAIGGDDVVSVDLYQDGKSSNIQGTNYLTRWKNKQAVGKSLLTPQNAYKNERDKRTQVINYLTASEASVAGLSTFIESYTANMFNLANCSTSPIENLDGNGTGLPAEYYRTRDFKGVPDIRTDTTINFNWAKNAPYGGFVSDRFSIRWSGRIKAPVTGAYVFTAESDDGVRLWLNDSLLINAWRDQGATPYTVSVNLIKDQVYKIRLEYYENKGKSVIKLWWAYPGQGSQIVPKKYLYGPPVKDTFKVNNYLVKERRVNSFRKANHISEINVLNSDGRRYVYGIPVYNLKQEEATFNVKSQDGNTRTGHVKYTNGVDNSTQNRNGKDYYYNSEQVPAYAHSFLLTGILSADYVDLTGNGISDDDLGDAVKFNYSKISGVLNPYRWRAPYTDSASYNDGLKTDNRDDKGNYVYGEKELWYLHTIESKTMIATFTVENRLDLAPINKAGNKYNDGSPKRLKEINLYSKADFLKDPTKAKPIKTVHFEYSYELCKGVNKPLSDSGKLTLKKVWFTYNGNAKGKRNPYIFHYKSNPNYNSKSYDRWGNYKDPLQNPGSTSGNVIGNDEYPYSLQDSTLAAVNAGAWNMDSIYLPSGGSMKIDFESDEYAFVQNRRAMQMFRIMGMGAAPNMSSGHTNKLYTNSSENLYVYITVPQPVANKTEVYRKYLSDITKLYFKIFVKMPSDNYGSGHEYVACYAELEDNNYGLVNANTIWVKIKGVSLKGDASGTYSPLAKAAIQFLRLNLPSKAYPGSEVGDQIDLSEAVKMVASMATNITSAFSSFDAIARQSGKQWASQIDLNRSFIRMRNPDYRKYGGGHRVKRITIYDNWNRMTNQRSAMYGQEYAYTTRREINGTVKTISSGVASYEPGIGGDENPFREPIEYTEKSSILGPVTLGYTEEPLGESLFPSPGVGYSKVKVRTINYKDKKSANGYSETAFYTAYDFPTYTDRTMIGPDSKKRYKPALANFLRIDAKHHIVLSQGFKIELNDMHGKLRSQASYAEGDPATLVNYTENIYKTENLDAENKRLSNTAMVMRPDGTIDSNAVIGKDVELMVDMREQLSITNGYNVPINSDLFTLPWPIPPFFLLPTMFNLAQREENLYRSVATLKVIQRYGIIDSVISIDKGSKVSSKDMLYDSETGEAILNRTQNEFRDPIYSFTYPSHWAYDGMGLAYKNIDVTLKNITIREGKITAGLPAPDSTFFSSGDEILVGGKQQTGAPGLLCSVPFSTFPTYTKIWAVDSTVSRQQGPKAFYFIDEKGKPYNGYDITMRVIRSGRRNQLGSVGSVTTLENPVIRNGSTGQYELVLNTNSKVINTGAMEYKDSWKVSEVKKWVRFDSTLTNNCDCYSLNNFIDFLIQHRKLELTIGDQVTVQSLIDSANYYGFNVQVDGCSLLQFCTNEFFYKVSDTASTSIYRAKMGSHYISIMEAWGTPVTLNRIYMMYSQYYPCEDPSFAANYGIWNGISPLPFVFLGYNSHYDDVAWGVFLDSSAICDVSSGLCTSPFTDSSFNPYRYGVAGNWRGHKAYTYYGDRAEINPAVATDIRKNGSFNDFTPFWTFQGGRLRPQYDTTRWVWNSEMTLVNGKGLEVENKDPLGRFNAGLYGYNMTLPTAVINNSRFRESAYEGFEDYGFNTQVCDTSCPSKRHFDFTAYKSKIDTLKHHSGKSSLKLNASEQVGLSANLSTEDLDNNFVPLKFTTAYNACPGVGNTLKTIKAPGNVLLPNFSPVKGQKMLISAWVREDQDCKCSSYVNNRIVVVAGSSSYIFQPTGSIIEGWQRYEGVFEIPTNATTLTVSLESTGSVAVHFDDLRIHPFNANMKSFVFHPVNLRLMAELDENNYASFYEYDDDGTLIRVKKETQRGIKTIKETRSALLKE